MPAAPLCLRFDADWNAGHLDLEAPENYCLAILLKLTNSAIESTIAATNLGVER
jgi:hypothetical protein